MAYPFEVVMVQLLARDLGGYHESLRSIKSDIFPEVYGHVFEENKRFLTAKSHGNQLPWEFAVFQNRKLAGNFLIKPQTLW